MATHVHEGTKMSHMDASDMSASESTVTGWVGWIAFAMAMLVLGGVFQSIIGLTALLNSQWFVATQQSVLLLDITTWGWVHLLMGIVLIITGLSLMSGNVAARTIAAVIAGISAIANLTWLGVYPIWSLVVITVDILIIYALTVHGGELRSNSDYR